MRFGPRRSGASVLIGIGVGLLAFSALKSDAEAQESTDLISLNARVTQDGVPSNADLDLTFEIYDAATSGTLLWRESRDDVAVRNGILAVKLGTDTALGDVFRGGYSNDRYVAIKRGGDEIVPRIKLTAVPYAHRASSSDITSLLWTGSGTSGYSFSQLQVIFQAADEELSDVAGLTPTDDHVIIGNGSAFVTEDPATVRTSLGLAIGSDVQGFDQQLTDLASLSYSGNAGKVVAVTGAETGFELVTPGGGSAGVWLDFCPADAVFPVATPAGLAVRNAHAVITFDASNDEHVIFPGTMPVGYASGTLAVKVVWVAQSATSGNCKWNMYWEALSSTDIDSDSYDTVQTVTTATSGTSGVPIVTTFSFTQTQADEIASGGAFRLKLERDANDGADTMSGDAQVLRISVEE